MGENVGLIVGDDVGDFVGAEDVLVGEDVGDCVGENVSNCVGEDVGDIVGEDVGDIVGEDVGDIVGEDVGESVTLTNTFKILESIISISKFRPNLSIRFLFSDFSDNTFIPFDS